MAASAICARVSALPRVLSGDDVVKCRIKYESKEQVNIRGREAHAWQVLDQISPRLTRLGARRGVELMKSASHVMRLHLSAYGRVCVCAYVRACVRARARVCERARVSFMFCAHKSCLMLV